MKKGIFLVSGCLLIAGAVFAQSVTITSPNGNENWPLGASRNITWTFSSFSVGTPMRLILYKEGVKVGDIAQNVPIGQNGAGTYAWTVGAYVGGTAAAGSGYKVRIRPQNSQAPMDASNAAFTIDPASEPPGEPSTPGGLKAHVGAATALISIRVLEPTKVSVWTIGETHTIRWQASDSVSYPLSIFLVSADHKIPIVDIGKTEGTSRPTQKTWVVTNNLYDGQYCIRITSADREHEVHSQPFTIKASRTRTLKVLPSAVYNKVHWHNIVSGDIWPGEKFHGGTSSIPDPGGMIIKYGYQRWYDDGDNHGYTLHRSFVSFNLGAVIAQLTHKYTVKGAWIDWKKAANSPQACAPNMWCLDAQMIVGDGSNMFGDVFAAFPKHLLTGDLQIQIQMAQQWLGDPAKNYGLVISAANEGQTEQNGQCVQFCDNVVMTIEVEEKLNN